MVLKKFISIFVVFFLGAVVFAAGGKYLVILKQDKVLLDIESDPKGVIRNSVKLNGKSVLDKIKNYNTAVLESTDGPRDATKPPVEYQELWLTNTIAVKGDSKVIDLIKQDDNVLEVIPDFEVMLENDVGTDNEEYFEDYTEEDMVLNWGVRFIGAPDAWEQFGTKGRGSLIGVLDTGINTMHKVFRTETGGCRISKFKDFANPGAMPDDDYGHGSHVAGIICGGIFKDQYIGVAPDSRIIFGKVFGADGKSFFSIVIEALQWMSDPDGNPATKDFPCAVNCSFRIPVPFGMTETEVQRELNKVARNMMSLGIIPVKSAGNGGGNMIDTITMPGYSPYFLTVGAINSDGERTSFSSIGKPGKSKPELMAPGKKVFSAKYSDNGTIITKSGTSMAAPAVCGVIALIKSANPGLSGRDIIKILVRTSNDIEAQGFDIKTGHGVVDAYRAVRSASKSKGNEARINSQLYKTITGRQDISNKSPWVDTDSTGRRNWVDISKDNGLINNSNNQPGSYNNRSGSGWSDLGNYGTELFDPKKNNLKYKY